MAGFKLNRPDGTVAIDSSYFNLGLRASGSLACTNAFYSGSYYVDLTVSADTAVVAYRCDRLCAVWSTTSSNGQVTYKFVCYGGTATVYYWLFDKPQYAQAFTSAGKMIVRRPGDGAVVFDSRNKYLKVQDFQSTNMSASDANRTTNYGKTPAIVMVKRAWSYQQVMLGDQSRQFLWTSSFAKTDGNQVQVTNVGYVSGQEKNPNLFLPSGQSSRMLTMILDIENY